MRGRVGHVRRPGLLRSRSDLPFMDTVFFESTGDRPKAEHIVLLRRRG